MTLIGVLGQRLKRHRDSEFYEQNSHFQPPRVFSERSRLPRFGCVISSLLYCFTWHCLAMGGQPTDDAPWQLPPVGACQLRILAPTLLELTLITAKPSVLARGELWDFVKRDGKCRLP